MQNEKHKFFSWIFSIEPEQPHVNLFHYGQTFNDVLNMQILGIVGDTIPDYGITLDEAIERQRNGHVNGHGNNVNGLNEDLM